MLLLLLPVAVLLGAIAYQSASAALDRHRYPAPGTLVKAAGAVLHMNVQGRGTPTVVLESGIGASSLSWAAIQPKIAAITSVVSYDRPGLGWSPLSRSPRTVPVMVAELRSALAQAHRAPPYLLVGHSFGGLLVRAYASRHPEEVAGLLLVDPVSVAAWADCSESDMRRLRLGANLCKRGTWLARIGLVRAALATLIVGRNWFAKLAARTAGLRGSLALARLAGEVGKLPHELWPVVCAHWSLPKCFCALARYLECLPESANYVVQMPAARGIPTIILSSSTATDDELNERDTWVAEAKSATGLSRHVRVPDAGHWLHLDCPELIVQVVWELLVAGVERV